MTEAILRVAQFMSMCIASQMVEAGVESRGELDRSGIAFSFMGNGASDMLTLGDILDFEKAAQELQNLETMRTATTAIQERADNQIERALGGIAKLSSLLQQVKTPEIASAFEIPPGLDIIQEVVRGAWHAMDNAEELGTGDLMVDRAYATDLNKALDDMQDAVVDTEFEIGDAPHFVTQWRQKAEAIFMTYGWRTPVEGEPETLPQLSGWYLVECERFPGHVDMGTERWYELVEITIEVDGYDNPVDLYAARQSKFKISHAMGEIDFWEDVIRYAMIPCMEYRAPTADTEDAPFDGELAN